MKSALSDKKKRTPIRKDAKERSFPIVAIGASAGGLEAVSALFTNLPPDTGMAFIFVQHLSSGHESMLPSILSKCTTMKVQKIGNMELIKPNNVYVIPNDKGIEVTDGHIRLIPRSKHIPAVSIDILFSSLARTHKKDVIGIVLSGNATDGTIGLRDIKKAGGITFAQDATAKNSSMPASAIHAGVVDFVLSPKKIAAALLRLSVKEKLVPAVKHLQSDAIADNDLHLNSIFELLYKRNGVDFRHYKPATIKRRVYRRLLKSNVKTIKDYARRVLKDTEEAALLYADLLINVTSFFRDAETFRHLKTTLLPRLLKDKKKGETLRIWVPACSTGEEAYSIALLIAELQEKQTVKIPVQIFATDLSEQVIRKARAGEYAKKDLKHFSAARMKRFFIKSGENFRVIKELRIMCVFATHNILSDPPFIRTDLISCRNLLIYFDVATQKKVMDSFHFSLNANGYLLLGKSESVGTSLLFNRLLNKYNIYTPKKNADQQKRPEPAALLPKTTAPMAKTASDKKNVKFPVLLKTPVAAGNLLDVEIDALLLSGFMPACAVINANMDILQFRGSTSLFLSHFSGRASLNILKMARPEFSFDLQLAIRKVFKTGRPVKKTNIEMEIDAAFRMFSLEVRPLKTEWEEPLLLVIFNLQEQPSKEALLPAGKNSGTLTRKIKKLTEELHAIRAEMQLLQESGESSNEQLQAANEEIVSSNEEFQTLNEELETSKEEIEASNEELISSNQELQMRNDLLTESYNYSEAIFATIHEPMLILHKNLRIKSASKSFYKKFLTTKEETEGTSLFELGNKQWNIPRLHELLSTILSKNSHFENFEVTHVFPNLGEKVMLLNANRIIQKTHREKLILLAIKDITERTVLQRKADGKNREDLRMHEAQKLELEKAAVGRTKQLEQKNIQLKSANKELTFQNNEKEKRASELGVANIELAFQNDEKEKRASELGVANIELAFQNDEKEKRASELGVANIELAFQNDEKEKRANELGIANIELAFQNDEKEKRANELGIANIELAFQNDEKEKRANELGIANIELAFQNDEKEKRANELGIANIELAFQNDEKEKRANELGIANIELAFQNDEKEKRANELGIANIELAFQNDEKEKRANELGIANIELAFQNDEKEKRANELGIANIELAFQNDEKEKRSEELSVANQDLTSFTYISSHDLQEPLRKIQNFATMLLREEEKNLSDTGKGYFNRMMKSAQRMQELIEDLLTYSRTKGGDRVFEEVNLNVMLNEVKKDFEDVFLENKVIIKAKNLAHVKVIPFQFRQLLHNLISNSLKFAKPDVSPVITIKSRMILAHKLQKEKVQPKNYCHITYSDNGIGFDPQYKERIFEVFQRLHSTEQYSGTGIGLAICKRIMENHKGMITATGEAGKGAQFDIYILME